MIPGRHRGHIPGILWGIGALVDQGRHHAVVPLVLVADGEDDLGVRVGLDELFREDGCWVICQALFLSVNLCVVSFTDSFST